MNHISGKNNVSSSHEMSAPERTNRSVTCLTGQQLGKPNEDNRKAWRMKFLDYHFFCLYYFVYTRWICGKIMYQSRDDSREGNVRWALGAETLASGPFFFRGVVSQPGGENKEREGKQAVSKTSV